MFNTFPQVLAALAARFELSETEIGSLVSAYMGSFAVVALLAPFWTPRVPWKATAVFSYIGIGVGVLMFNYVTKTELWIAMAVLGGFACIIFTISVAIISATTDPDRNFAFKLIAEMLLGIVLIFVVANLINAEFGYYGFVYGLLALYAITGIGIAWLPANFLGNTAAQGGGVAVAGFNLSAALAIFGLVCSFGAYTAVWSFAAVIGINNGFSEETVNNILLFALLAGLAGAGACAVISQKYGQNLPLNGGLALMIVAILLLVYGGSVGSFAVALCLINALLQFTLAYQMGLISEVDVTGRYSVLIPFFLAFSAAIGGEAMGGLIEEVGVERAMLSTTVAIGLAIAILVYVIRKEHITARA